MPGMNIDDINTAIRTGFVGEVAGLVFEGEKRFDLVVRLDKVNRREPDDVRNLFIGNRVSKFLWNNWQPLILKTGPIRSNDDAK